MNIDDSVISIKGIGNKTADLLSKCNINSIYDLILYFPRDYRKYKLINRVNETSDGDLCIIKCVDVGAARVFRTSGRKMIVRINFFDGEMQFTSEWFNNPYIAKSFMVNKTYFLCGTFKKFKNQMILLNPKKVDKDLVNSENIIPVYSLKKGLTNNFFRKTINSVLNCLYINENLPKWILDKYNLCSLDCAIKSIHNPKGADDLKKSLRRLKYQEMLAYSLKLILLKNRSISNRNGIQFKISKELRDLKESLPYELTNSQKKVIREILIDEKKKIQMNRLVQGDVGSGKTVVAIIAMFNVVKNGYQAVLMAPTEILANQHYSEIKKLLERFNVNVVCLVGSESKKVKDKKKKEIREGKYDIIVGTHALFEDDVIFKKLGFIVTDEQHRFGVEQRCMLKNKAMNADMLVMSATPIPRTLALYLYGDLDISVIDELPKGRKKVDTYYISKSQSGRAFMFARKEILKGRQVYIVCPLIEENPEFDADSVEEIYKKLKEKYFKDISFSMLHGRMPQVKKNEVINGFKDGKIKAVISTTVIEVGVDVPNASLMIVVNAERFGLAELHQLRGRVGRGNQKSYCILIAEIKNENIKKRMEILKSSSDGFYISEQDMKLRGSGELMGLRQHGDDGLILSDIVEDVDILKRCYSDAEILSKSNDECNKKIVSEILKKLDESTKYIVFN